MSADRSKPLLLGLHSIASRQIIVILILMVLVAVPKLSAADPHNDILHADNLLKACTTTTPEWVNFCNGFFQAAYDSAAISGTVCAAPGTTRTELVEMYTKIAPTKLRANPGLGQKPALLLAVQIMKEKMPCK